MKEIGGYIELDRYSLPMLHEGAVALNCGRNCLAYLIKARKIKKIAIPFFLCDSIQNVCEREDVQIRYYYLQENFMPEDIELGADEWLYLVNYYGIISNHKIESFVDRYDRVIVDNAHAYYQTPIHDVDTLYTCRKFFGVADGAFLYTNAGTLEGLDLDVSYNRMNYLLGRYEDKASRFYNDYVSNNKHFKDEPIKKMSRLTMNLLHAIDYECVKEKRTQNFKFLNSVFRNQNNLKVELLDGAYAYPLWIEKGKEIRSILQKNKIYIPTLWPGVIDKVSIHSREYEWVENILPIPCDQRYDEKDLLYVVNMIQGLI